MQGESWNLAELMADAGLKKGILLLWWMIMKAPLAFFDVAFFDVVQYPFLFHRNQYR